jgi:hypothetical protein
MNFYITLQKHGIKNAAARGRRSRKVFRLEPESLENRTPMSSGLGTALESIRITRAAEIAIVVHATTATVSTSVHSGSSEQAVSTIESELDSASGVLVVAGSTLPVSATASETDQSNEPVVAELSAAIRPDNAGELSAIESLQGTSDSAPGGGSVKLSAVETSGNGSLVGDLHQYLAGSTLGPGGDGGILLVPPGDMVVPPLIGVMLGTAVGRVSPQASTDDDDSDMSYSGPLEPILATADPADFSTPTPSTDRMLTPAFTGRQLQLDAYGEYSNSSGLSYLATGQGTSLSFQSSADDLLAWEETTSEPVPPGSITIGGLSLTNLLSGPDVSALTDPDSLEQVAELVPLPESALALAATLWTVPSDLPTSTPRWQSPAHAAIDGNARANAASSWTLFVAGVDQALEQTYREIQENIPCTQGRYANGDTTSPDEPLEWQGPILPAARRRVLETIPKVSQTSRQESDGRAGQGTTPTRLTTPLSSEDSPPIVLGAMPLISVVSLSTVIAGWIWRKRQQWHRSRLGKAASRCRHRG